MITDDHERNHLTVTKLSVLLEDVTPKNSGYFYCSSCFHSFRTKNKLDLLEKVYKDHKYYEVSMLNEENNMIKDFRGQKLIKIPLVTYVGFEF